MITLKEKQYNTIAYQKENDTPLVSKTYIPGYGYTIVMIPTLQNDTGSASIAFTTSSSEANPRWETLSFDISSSTDYTLGHLKGLPGTTYDLEVWYGPQITGSAPVWSTTNVNWSEVTDEWSFGGVASGIPYYKVVQDGTLEYKDRVFVTGSVSPIEKKYISSNENAVYTVYQG